MAQKIANQSGHASNVQDDIIQSTDPKSNNATNACHQSSSFNKVLLPTAMIPIKLPNNEIKYCPEMLDSSAQISMITEM